MRVRSVRATNYTMAEKTRLDIILDSMQAAINSVQFRDFILNHQPFDTQENFSNQEIYDMILAGKEENSTEADEVADLELLMDGSFSRRAIGETMDGVIITFRNKFNDKSNPEMAGHYAHEYCHLLSFEDPTLTGRAVNVPYQVGEIVKQLSTETERTFLPETVTETTRTRSLRRTTINFNKTTVLTSRTKKKKAAKKKTSKRKPVSAKHKKSTKKAKPATKRKAVKKRTVKRNNKSRKRKPR